MIHGTSQVDSESTFMTPIFRAASVDGDSCLLPIFDLLNHHHDDTSNVQWVCNIPYVIFQAAFNCENLF